MPDKDNGWDVCKRDIYHRFDIVDKKMDEFSTDLQVALAKIHQEEINRAVFKKEVSFKGALAGTIPTLAVIVLWVLKELFLR